MKLIRNNISIVLLVFLLAPSIMQLSHILIDDHHDHNDHDEITVTVSDDEQKINDNEADCELCDLKINTFTIASTIHVKTFNYKNITSVFDHFYSFKNDQNSIFLLRGPPMAV